MPTDNNNNYKQEQSKLDELNRKFGWIEDKRNITVHIKGNV